MSKPVADAIAAREAAKAPKPEPKPKRKRKADVIVEPAETDLSRLVWHYEDDGS